MDDWTLSPSRPNRTSSMWGRIGTKKFARKMSDSISMMIAYYRKTVENKQAHPQKLRRSESRGCKTLKIAMRKSCGESHRKPYRCIWVWTLGKGKTKRKMMEYRRIGRKTEQMNKSLEKEIEVWHFDESTHHYGDAMVIRLIIIARRLVLIGNSRNSRNILHSSAK